MTGHKCPGCGRWIRCPTCDMIITTNNLSIVTDDSSGVAVEYCCKECRDKRKKLD